MTHKLLRFKKLHYYLIPIVALVVWWGQLIALLVAWYVQGSPTYNSGKHQNPVYISDIGATNLQPLFIACTGFQLIFFLGTLIMEFVLRKKRKLQPYVSKKQTIFAIISIICAVIGQLGILFVSIFKTTRFHTVHLSFVGVFIFFIFWACFFNFLNSFIFGNYPQRLCPNHEKVVFGNHRWANLYMVSFFIKLLWLMAALSFAVVFGYYMKHGNRSLSASFEWTIAFWYGLLLLLWSLDLFPSAVKHYRIRHPEEFEEPFVDNHRRLYSPEAGGANSSAPENSSSTARNLNEEPKDTNSGLAQGSTVAEVERPAEVHKLA